jgi:hypothetical protein
MDVSNIASTAASMTQDKLAGDVQLSLLKRAMDIGSQLAKARSPRFPLLRPTRRIWAIASTHTPEPACRAA